MEKPLQICEYNYIDDTTIEFVVPYDVLFMPTKLLSKRMILKKVELLRR